MFLRNNRIWRRGLFCKSSRVASNQVIKRTRWYHKRILKRRFSSMGLFMDWKLQTEKVIWLYLWRSVLDLLNITCFVFLVCRKWYLLMQLLQLICLRIIIQKRILPTRNEHFVSTLNLGPLSFLCHLLRAARRSMCWLFVL